MSGPVPSLFDLGWGAFWDDALAQFPIPGARPGRVIRRDRGAVVVATERGPVTAAVGAAGEVITGDWVVLDGPALVAVLPRRGLLRRRGPGGEEQPLAANVDVVLLVCGLDRPVKPGRIQRGAVQAWDAGVDPVVVLTKADLVPAPGRAEAEVRRHAPGLEVLVVSARSGEGLEGIRRVLGGRTAVLVGESGAGKSSLLNAFAGAALAATGDVRRTDAKGRHTTTRRELHVVPGAGILIDTPGLRALGLAAGSDAVDAAFDDVERLAAACRFRNCRHEREPGCAVAAAAEGGGLSDRRLRLYRELRRETARAELRERPHEQRRYERRFSKQVRVGERLKRGDRR